MRIVVDILEGCENGISIATIVAIVHIYYCDLFRQKRGKLSFHAASEAAKVGNPDPEPRMPSSLNPELSLI